MYQYKIFQIDSSHRKILHSVVRVGRKRNGVTAENGTAPRDTLSRSLESKMRLRDTKPHKRTKIYYRYVLFNFTFKVGLLRWRGYAFLAGADHANNEIIKRTTAIPPGNRRVLKKVTLIHPPYFCYLKRKRRLEIAISKPP